MVFEEATPEGWETHEIGEYLSLTTGFAFKSTHFVDDPDAGPPLIRIRDLKTHSPETYFAGETPDGYDVEPGEYLIGMDGEFEAVVWQGEKALLNQRVLKFDTADPDQLDRSFLFYRIQPELRRLEESIAGTTVKHLSTKHLKELRVDLPPLAEQKKIAEILGAVDNAIAKTKAVIEQSDIALNYIVNELLENSAASKISFRDAGIEIIDGDRGKEYPKQADLLNNGHCLFLSAKNVTKNGFAFDECQFISQDRHERMGKGTLQRQDIVLTTRGTLGNVAFYDDAISFNTIRLNSGMVVVRTPDNINPKFLYLFMRSSSFFEQVRFFGFGSAQPQLTVKLIYDFQLPLATPEKQIEVLEAARGLLFLLELENQNLEQLRLTKTGLMAELLSGRKRVPDFATKAAYQKPKTVQPAFKRAVLAAEVVSQLHQDNTFGAVKHEKVVFLSEHHAELHDDVDRHAYKEAAGPYDPKARRSVDANFKRQKWFDVVRDGKRVRYEPLEKQGSHKPYYDRYFSDKADRIQWIIDLMKPLDTRQSEIVATLYAVWNDFLLADKEPSDDDIVDGVLNNWTDNKKSISRDRWLSALGWMKEKGLVPRGTGERTRVAAQ